MAGLSQRPSRVWRRQAGYPQRRPRRVLELVTDRYLGRLCDFNACPKAKAECRAPGCGDVALLRQHEGFRWRQESLVESRAVVRLFERATGLQRRASDRPLLDVEAG